MKLLILLLLVSCLPSYALAEARDYRCKDFASDFEIFNLDKSITLREIGPDFAQSLGVIIGVYFAKIGERYDPASRGLASFTTAVAKDCETHSNDPVGRVAIDLADDRLKQAAQQNPEKYQQINILDLKLDAAKLKGKRIETKGTLQTLGKIAMISTGVMDMNKIFVEVKGLSHESRKYIVTNCDSGCEVVLRGKVTDVMLNPGIYAEELKPE